MTDREAALREAFARYEAGRNPDCDPEGELLDAVRAFCAAPASEVGSCPESAAGLGGGQSPLNESTRVAPGEQGRRLELPAANRGDVRPDGSPSPSPAAPPERESAERCQCGAVVMERWCGWYGDAWGMHTRKECTPSASAPPEAAAETPEMIPGERAYGDVMPAIRRVADSYRSPLAKQVVQECWDAADRAWPRQPEVGGPNAAQRIVNDHSGADVAGAQSAPTQAASPPAALDLRTPMERAIEERAATPEPWRVTDQLLDAWLADAEVAPVAVAEMLKPLTINLVRNVVDARAQLAEARARIEALHAGYIPQVRAAEAALATLRAQVGRWADEVAPYVPAKLHSEGEPHRGCCGHHDAMTALAEMRAASTSTGGSAT